MAVQRSGEGTYLVHTKTMVKWAVGALTCFALVVIGITILHFTHWQLLRSILVMRVRQTTNRELKIKGGFDVDLSLSPLVTAEQVTFANAPWGSREELVIKAWLEAA
jgi:AsmA family protein